MYRIILLTGFGLLMAWSTVAGMSPRVRLTLDGGLTDNLYFDSSATSDQLLRVGLDMELPIYKALQTYYSGQLSTFADTPELESYDHILGVSLDAPLKPFSSVWIDAGGSRCLYNAPYEIYKRHGLFLATGAEVSVASTVLVRVAVDLTQSTYPEYSNDDDNERTGEKEQAIDSYDLNALVGANATIGGRNAVDVEAGVQRREYDGQDGPVTTLFVLSGRISRPLNRYTGVALVFRYQDQVDLAEKVLYTFYVRGVNINEHLWDGYEASLVLTRILGQWKLRLSASYLDADYIEAPLDLTGRLDIPSRQDDAVRFNTDARRVLWTSSNQMRIWGYANYEYERNRSTAFYYDYTLNEVHLGLMFEW